MRHYDWLDVAIVVFSTIGFGVTVVVLFYFGLFVLTVIVDGFKLIVRDIRQLTAFGLRIKVRKN
jgi:hypothetical protein